MILNALRALGPGRGVVSRLHTLPSAAARDLYRGTNSSRRPSTACAASPMRLTTPIPSKQLVAEANAVVSEVVRHERNDEASVYPRLTRFLRDGHGLSAMSRAHREIMHLARLLARLADGVRPPDVDRYLVRDAAGDRVDRGAGAPPQRPGGRYLRARDGGLIPTTSACYAQIFRTLPHALYDVTMTNARCPRSRRRLV